MSGFDGANGGWLALGDSALLWRGSEHSALAWFQWLQSHQPTPIRDVVLAFHSVAVHFDPCHGPAVASLLAGWQPPDSNAAANSTTGCLQTIPVCYGGENGPDLATCARSLGRTCDEIITLHSSAEYRVAAIGFSPGFPYLIGLPHPLHLPRKPCPQAVAAGTVAIAGAQTGIYPVDSPGGWHQLGRTSLELFSPAASPPSLLAPGDRVRFLPVADLPPPLQTASPPDPPAMTRDPAAAPTLVEVLSPGAFTTVQDLGRLGFRHLGVGTSGGSDPRAIQVVNQLVGNPAGAAVLECAASGPVLRFCQPAVAAWLGWNRNSGRPIHVAAGECLDLASTAMTSARGFIAISGGIAVPALLGSRSTDVRARLGGYLGRALTAGDRLPLGPYSCQPKPCPAKPPTWFIPWRQGRFGWGCMQPNRGACQTIRCLRGVDGPSFPATALHLWYNREFRLSPHGNRTAVRLTGPLLPISPDQAKQPSTAVAAGSVQVTPDGCAIVLLNECQTMGGYPQIAHVISADLPLLATAMPDTPVRFVEVSLAEARTAWHETCHEGCQITSAIEWHAQR